MQSTISNVKTEKKALLAVYEDSCKDLEEATKQIKSVYAKTAKVVIRSASKVSVSELLASDCYAFGVNDASCSCWNEIKRLFTGMNLAGRKAVFFSSKPGNGNALQEAFKPAELTVSQAEQTVDLSTWKDISF